MSLGCVISGGALLFWIYLNGLAASWNTSNTDTPVQWFTMEAVYFFWLPFAVGSLVAIIGWKRP
jgi:hypothetical protein